MKSIRNKIIVFSILATLIPSIGLGVLSFYQNEMMIKEKIFFSREIADFGLECQNMLIEEGNKDVQKNYPHICTLAMLVNEYFCQEKVPIHKVGPFDKYDAFREMGIPCPPKARTKQLFRFGR